MFTQIELNNFRGLEYLKLADFKQINVFVGDNSIGKTTILDGLFLSINPNNVTLLTRINQLRGIEEIQIDRSGEDYWKSFFYQFDFKKLVKLSSKTDQKERTITITPRTSTSTSNNIKNKQIRENTEYFEPIDTSLRNIVGLNVHFTLDDESFNSSVFLDSTQMRTETDNNYTETLNGTYINSTITGRVQNFIKHFEEAIRLNNKSKLIANLQKMEPTIVDINRFSNSLIVTDTRFSEAVNACTYGNGFIKYLAILSIILSMESTNICLIDEIENGLYHTKQCQLWRSILHLTNNNPHLQLFITTHSLEMLHNLYRTSKDMNLCDIINLYRIEKTKDNNIQTFRYTNEQYIYAWNKIWM